MATTELTLEEILAINSKYFKNQMNQAEKWINSISIASYSIEKVFRRVDAINLIKEIEKGTENHAVNSILKGIVDAIEMNFVPVDCLEENAIYDPEPNDKEFLTIQNTSIWLSDSEDIEIPNPNNRNDVNKSYHFIFKNPDNAAEIEPKGLLRNKQGNLSIKI